MWRWWTRRERGAAGSRRVSLIVEGALLPGHGLDGAWHGGRLERGRSVRMEGVADDGVDGGEGPLGGQGESVLVLRLEEERRRKRVREGDPKKN